MRQVPLAHLESIKADTLHHILSQYTQRPVPVRLQRVSYRQGPVVMIAIERDPRAVPYAVKKACRGRRQRVEVGDVYVWHGSITEEPTEAELQALRDEAALAKSRQ